GVSSCLRSHQEKGTAAGAMRSDHECLLDVGGLGRPGDEKTEARALETDSIVGLMHVVNNLAGWHDQHEVLGNHEDRPMRTEAASGNPYCAVLRDAELAGDDGEVEPFK